MPRLGACQRETFLRTCAPLGLDHLNSLRSCNRREHFYISSSGTGRWFILSQLSTVLSCTKPDINIEQTKECEFFPVKVHSALCIAALFACTLLQSGGKQWLLCCSGKEKKNRSWRPTGLQFLSFLYSKVTGKNVVVVDLWLKACQGFCCLLCVISLKQ